jgi:NADPH-dependent curcumin reductase CurA
VGQNPPEDDPAMLEVRLRRLPRGVPLPDDFETVEAALPEPAAGQLLCRVVYLSLDPYLRGAISGRHLGHAPLRPGDVVPGRSLAQVVRSRLAGFADGDYVVAETGWREHALSAGQGARKVDPAAAPLSTALGVLGMPGLTAWAGVVELLRPRAGDTFVVSAAAGPVGSTAGQLARIAGCRVVGIAGSAEKCAHATGLFGFDACVDYKHPRWRDHLAAACPDGVDGYFDNVGGDTLQAVLEQLRPGGTVVLCGLVSQYNLDAPTGLSLGPVIARRARLLGLVVYDHEHRFAEFHTRASAWLREGRLRYLEDRATGLPSAPAHFHRLMSGQNVGKSLVVVGPESA